MPPADYSTLIDEAFAYDENGNRTDDITNSVGTHDYSIGSNNRLLSDGVYNYLYDNEGNRTRRTEIATGDYVEYGWDHRNRLVSVTTYDANGTPLSFSDDEIVQKVDNAYDTDNQWIRRLVDPDGETGSSPLQQTVFVYRNGQVELQFDGEGAGPLGELDVSHQYLWGPGVDMLLADEQIEGNSAVMYREARTYWTLTDHLGTVRDVVDSDGELRLHRAYDAFGNVVGETHFNASGVAVSAGTAGYVDVDFSCTGKYFDKATGLQNNWNRW